ncbi:hypothetical protein K443DRAFT_89816 [Laccaria amethystina LaAM-08-1]|uniref:Uncharacterized protein n=1 Tax=Laccaria amethystina LaAM-08-1 TaxID=1095629 RepID=A0A0C9Y7T5_9AGAR|nr:hypothetical protein K443DRAFT_89816 [Laccaria amethystina LaAM-08-1]
MGVLTHSEANPNVRVHECLSEFLNRRLAPYSPRSRRLCSRSSRVCAIVKELQFDTGIELGLEGGEKSDVVSQCLDQSFSSSFALQIHPSSKRYQRG